MRSLYCYNKRKKNYLFYFRGNNFGKILPLHYFYTKINCEKNEIFPYSG